MGGTSCPDPHDAVVVTLSCTSDLYLGTTERGERAVLFLILVLAYAPCSIFVSTLMFIRRNRQLQAKSPYQNHCLPAPHQRVDALDSGIGTHPHRASQSFLVLIFPGKPSPADAHAFRPV